jgi:Circadian oscillating protein COP23
MIKNPFYTAITALAIALSATSLQAKESYSQNTTDTTFVCATEIQTPTMFAYTPGAVNLTPLITWHQDYLLPEQSGKEVCKQTAATLQNLSQKKQPQYLKTQEAEDRTVICMVTQETQNCSSENSVTLFSINPNYDAACILDNKEPLECVAIGRVRGVYSVPDSPYTPSWWPW